MFKTLIAIDAVAALVIGYFFVVGLTDGSISAFNVHLWLGILLAVAAVLAGGTLLRNAGKPLLGNLVLAVLAVPALLYGLFAAVVVFQIVNLPVEFDASARAKAELVNLGIVDARDMGPVKSVLSAAAMTYVAATLQALLTLLYFIVRFLGDRR